MSDFYEKSKRGEQFTRLYMDLMDTSRQSWRFKRKDYDSFALNRPDVHRRNAIGLREIHTLIDIGFKRYQTVFEYNTKSPNKILFPNLINLQDEDIIHNVTKDQLYIVKEAILDDYDIFTGYAIIEIKGDDTINIEKDDILEVPEDRLVAFLVSFPSGEVHEESDLSETPLKDGKFKSAITYRVRKSETAGLRPFEDAYRQHIPQFIGAEDDPEDLTYYYEVYTQQYDNLVQYIVWTTSNMLSDFLIEVFETFLISFLPVLIQNGVLMAYSEGRSDDRYVTRWRPDINSRTLLYYYRTQKARVVRMRKISDVIIKNPSIKGG